MAATTQPRPAPRPVAWRPQVIALPTASERHRRLIVRLVGAIYWLLIFEGVLRKWIFPQWGRELFFVRDPFVILVYVLVFARRTHLPRSRFREVETALAIAGGVLSLLHLAAGLRMPDYFLLYGWRNYFLYMPLAFIVARYFNLWDLARLARRTLLVSIPMAALVLVQLTANSHAPINAGSADNPTAEYVVHTTENGVVRPSGTFTSDQGLTCFSASVLAMALAFWVLPAHSRPVSRTVLILATGANLMTIGLSGSRGVLLWAALIAAGAFLGLFFVRPRMHFKASILLLSMLAVGAISLPVLFPRTTDAFMRRWVEAGAAESKAYGEGGVLARMLYEMGSFRLLVSNTPAGGYGLGSAGNAAWKLGIRDELILFHNQDEMNAAETDWGRNVLELGPVLGLVFVVFRVVFVGWLLVAGLAATRRTGHPFPWFLSLYIAVILGFWQITGNGTLNGYGWLFVGFALAAILKARKCEVVPR